MRLYLIAGKLNIRGGVVQSDRPLRKEKAPRGRPPKPASDARSRRVVTFLTEEEFEQISAMAHREDLTISATAHQLLLKAFSAAD